LEQQVIWQALSLVTMEELVGMFRALRDHPDRNLTIDGVNQGLDEGYDLFAVFGDVYKGLYPLQYEGCLMLEISLLSDGIWLSVGYSGAAGEVSEYKFTYAADGQLLEVEFDSSHNDYLITGIFDDTVRLS